MREKTKELYKRADGLWGLDCTWTRTIEEATELIQALCKWWRRADPATMPAIVEGISGLEIMLEQLAIAFNSEKEVKEMRLTKLERLKKRIEKEEFKGGKDGHK